MRAYGNLCSFSNLVLSSSFNRLTASPPGESHPRGLQHSSVALLPRCRRCPAPSRRAQLSFPPRFTHQCTVQRSRRDFHGSLPGSTADHEHFASKKTQTPAGIIWGTSTQPLWAFCGMGVFHWYSLRGKHGASIKYTKANAASELSKEKKNKKQKTQQ